MHFIHTAEYTYIFLKYKKNLLNNFSDAVIPHSLTTLPENLQAVKILGLTRVLHSKENNTRVSLIQTQLLVHSSNNN